VVESLGGRYSVELGINVDGGNDEIERWGLAATLFGGRISAKIAERTFAAFEDAGVHSVAAAGRRPDTGHLVELLDAGGYARYDFQTAGRLPPARDALARLRELAGKAQIDVRDPEAALVRLSLAHRRGMAERPGRAQCTLFARPA
jgi:hypothetical protein